MSSVLLSEAVIEYLDVRSARFSPATVKNEGFVLARFAATVTGGRDIQVRHLTPEHVGSWFIALLRPHRDRSGVDRPAVQPSTHNFTSGVPRPIDRVRPGLRFSSPG